MYKINDTILTIRNESSYSADTGNAKGAMQGKGMNYLCR